MKFYDAHNHLQDERFSGYQSELMGVCEREGIAGMVVNGASESDWPQVLSLARQFPGNVTTPVRRPKIIPSFGYHPWYLHERSPDWLETLKHFLNEIHSAIGEIGLDRWKPDLPYAGQEEVFLAQRRLAAERNRPASIHCLRTWGRLYELLRENPRPACGFLLHSYGGSAEMIPAFARLGAYFSFPGYFLQERKFRQREVFKQVPPERLLIETDAPDQFLPEEQIRHPLSTPDGQPLNHPANLPAIYSGLATWLGGSEASLASRIETNFQRLFGSL